MYHTIKSEGPEHAAAGNAKTLVDSITFGGVHYRHESIPSPGESGIHMSIYPDRSLADRARRAEIRSAAVLTDMGLQCAVVAPRAGLISLGWVVLANVHYDTEARRAVTTISPDEVRKASLDPDELQRRLDTLPRRRPGQGQPKRGARPPQRLAPHPLVRHASVPSAAADPRRRAPAERR